MKRYVSFVLTIVIMLTCTLPMVAAQEQCSCGFNPVIYVGALGSAPIYENYGTAQEKVLFRPDAGPLVKSAIRLLAPHIPEAVSGNYDGFADALIQLINDNFGNLALDENGNSKDNVYSIRNMPSSAAHGVDISYGFGYDLRLDPVEHADALHLVIQRLKQLTGHSKVQLKASSMGGVVTMAYLEKYGTDDIETIIFQNCPILGTAVAGELFCKKVEVNKNALLNYALDAIPSLKQDLLQGFLYGLATGLDDIGMWTSLVGVADKLIINMKDKVYAECLIPIFGTFLGLWSFVPDEYYETAKSIMVDEEAQAGLVAKMDNYHYNVQCRAKEILEAANESIKIYNVVGYDIQRTPLVTAHKNTSDGTVDTKYASVGAITAPIGECLPEDYTQAIPGSINHISPLRKIDASTCALPLQTWFIKDMLHCNTHKGHHKLYELMLTTPEQFTISSFSEYPQFMQNNIPNECFDEVRSLTPFEVFKNQPNFTNFVIWLRSLIEKILKAIFAFAG